VYRIAEEAVLNALTHGEPEEISIALSETKDGAVLMVRDNGAGLPKSFSEGGLGLHMMRYRARMIRGSLELRRNTPRGAVMICTFQKRAESPPR
jgi:signal transduction histidine kinase